MYKAAESFFKTAKKYDQRAPGARSVKKNQTPNLGSSARLGRNLRKVGQRPRLAEKEATRKRTPDDAAHLVPKKMNTPAAERCREILEKFDIDIDNEINGKFLPRSAEHSNPFGKALHPDTHTDKYLNALEKMLERAETQKQAEKMLRYVARQLDNGPWPP